MSEKNQKLLFYISAASIFITTAVNVLMQANSGEVNGTYFGPIAIVCGVIVVTTIVLVESNRQGPRKITGITTQLIILILLAILASRIATNLWGFTPGGWQF